ncbi:FK506-binding protein 15 [Microplitis mediator]|uniref:FK506-binding protein 15 n=1 Tax=Microplitis mediator TaxID=375433 RepID=UPI0025550EBB|nr:FK506-binding protein 15 [Microplitis mediator]
MSRGNQLPNLDKIFKDDDEQDFNPIGGSNLASIFGTSSKTDSLSKTPSKKSKSDKTKVQTSPSSSTTSSKTDVILAKVIHAYKLQNGQYSPLGKLGIALTGNTTTKTYLLILYRNKNEHISVVTLTLEFKFSIQENNYVSYYDGNNDNWSILFDSNDSCTEFAREIAVSKYLLRQGKTDETIYYQDLTVCNNDKEVASEGDNISIKYSIINNIVQPLKIQSIPVQTMTVQISSDDNWERSLLGISHGCKRILILSPSKQISLGPGFPRDKDVALDIEVLDITKEIKNIPSPKPPTGKASLISRMAKMGQSILPKVPTSTTTDSEDTEEDMPIKSPRRMKTSDNGVKNISSNVKTTSASSQENIPDARSNFVRSNNPMAVPTAHGSLVPAAFTPGAWATPIPQQFMSTVDGQLYSFPSSVSQSPVTGSLDPNINIFLSETRTHNAEIRMGMSKISDNVQKLLDKFHILELQNATASPSNEKALESSLKMLLALNLNKNDTKTSETEKNSSDTELEDAKKKIRSLEDELKTIKNYSIENVYKLERLEEDNKVFSSEEMELKKTIKELELKLTEVRSEHQRALEDIKSTNEQVIKYQKDNIRLEQKIMMLETEQKNLGNKNLVSDDKDAEIKQLMNKMYQTLMTKFTDESYTSDYIKTTIASTIKAITLQVLKEKNDIESRSNNREIKDCIEPDTFKTTKESVSSASTDDGFILPVIDKISDSKDIDTASVLSEPPPIPPMDLDDDWLP